MEREIGPIRQGLGRSCILSSSPSYHYHASSRR